MSDAAQQDIQALAKGGRTNVLGFVIRLAATAPFLIIASRMYGAEALGRFASATVMIELAGQLCTLGQKRGLAQRLAADGDHPTHSVADAMTLAGGLALLAAAVLYAVPWLLYPNATYTELDRLLVLAILPATLTDIALAALAYRYDVATSVRARAVVEPWTLSIAAVTLFFLGRMQNMVIAESNETATVTVYAEHYDAELDRPMPLRYSDADQQRLYPGDLGCQYAAQTTEKTVIFPSKEAQKK